jgi:hypothetical protein
MPSPVALLACALLLAACDGADLARVQERATPAAVPETASPALQPDDLVDLTLYFRSGEGHDAYLEPVTREVDVDQDLPRRALELLLSGPGVGEEGLDPPLPTTTHVRDLRVESGVAHVELSPEAVRDAASVGKTADNEALALGALANTLTGFPSIDKVQVTVSGAGVDSARFWDGWGMPVVLVRDESLIGPSGDGEGLLDLRRFAAGTQETGVKDAEPVEATAVRVRDRLTHVRVTVELAHADGSEHAAKVPPTRGRVSGDELVVVIADVASYVADFGEHQTLDLSVGDVEELRVEHDGGALTLRLRVEDAANRPVWLHALSSPTRVVLDVKK